MDNNLADQINLLQGGRRTWWDVVERRIVLSETLYIPFGCPDWGETNGNRNTLCTFCALPTAVQGYREIFYQGAEVPHEDHIRLFAKTFNPADFAEEVHTLMVFNGGSFLAMPWFVQENIMQCIASCPSVQHVVIESRAPLVSDDHIFRLTQILSPKGKRFTVRIGVETKNDHLRLKILRKGHSKKQLKEASEILRRHKVYSGGYVLLNPAPGLTTLWSEEEAVESIQWVLDPCGLGMNEVYFGATCVGPNTPLATEWEEGRYSPPSLNSVLRVLHRVLPQFPGRIHLLPFADVPSFIAVPSNHSGKGLPESLEGAEGCDEPFHEMFHQYRETMNPDVLRLIPCFCVS